jgi:hypothetical protein
LVNSFAVASSILSKTRQTIEMKVFQNSWKWWDTLILAIKGIKRWPGNGCIALVPTSAETETGAWVFFIWLEFNMNTFSVENLSTLNSSKIILWILCMWFFFILKNVGRFCQQKQTIVVIVILWSIFHEVAKKITDSVLDKFYSY